ncbi:MULTISPECIES: hypothetical protein [Lacticaseibacillus]|uniref:Uncharacterized protein n=1 Tax=Lacticaseibacillus styriensis TaxID=3068306 RepID=A0ABY9LCS0_9LACO|nr:MULTISPECIES: hypothetical protein [Lacticaseibacillus]WLV81534.1 hypothetical protein LACSTY_000770 [Lacticaseibacillus sp. NCIMB 15473]WRM21269.1 hypothetical protein T1M39_06190 [Lacticaseibacillus paracasei]
MNGRTQEKLENAVTEFVVAQLKNKEKSPEMVAAIAELIESLSKN